MPRKGPAPKRPLVVDPVYGSPLVTQLVNKILNGRQEVHRRDHRLRALEGTRAKTGTDRSSRSSARSTTSSRLLRSRAAAWVARPTRSRSRSRVVGRPRWLFDGWSATPRQRREKTMTERLMNEILDASNGLGAAVKRREDTHKMPSPTRPSRTTAGSTYLMRVGEPARTR